MSLHYGQTVVTLRAPFVVDRYGNTTSERDWTRATSTTVARVDVVPQESTEAVGDRPVVVTGWRLITRPGTDVDLGPGDRVTALGRLLEVDGEPARYLLGARHHHTEVRLKEVNG
ncbi:hypothetical protein ACFRMQ_09575 [Kitasatospora sp. NPDC056783]|uniref:hypothetical protein n=1 Tax=Kitasatospora sp. NPDC056783 TaxID=3345943 RepID=UPI00368D7C4E